MPFIVHGAHLFTAKPPEHEKTGDLGDDLGAARNASISDVWNDGEEAMNRHAKSMTPRDKDGAPTSPSKKTYAQMAADSRRQQESKRNAPIHDNVDAWAGE